VLLVDAPLTFREFMTNEELPLATIFRDVLAYLRDRDDMVLFGAQAVNAYCEPPRMTHDLDVLALDAARSAESLRDHLATTFHIATRVREVVPGLAFRVYQLRKPKNRHLVDLRKTARLPEHQVIEGVRVVSPAELVAMKSISIAERRGREKELSDRLDLARLLRTFPALRADETDIAARITRLGGAATALDAWREAVASPLEPEPDDVDDS
jgi:hypothetical protein